VRIHLENDFEAKASSWFGFCEGRFDQGPNVGATVSNLFWQIGSSEGSRERNSTGLMRHINPSCFTSLQTNRHWIRALKVRAMACPSEVVRQIF